jgi:nitrous oxidase accessory protein NosD
MHRGLGPARLAVLTVALAVFVTIAASPALANHVQCGDVITQDTTLDSDLTCAGDGLVVDGSAATVDLSGHTIQGAGAGIAIVASNREVEVRAGTIRGFQLAVDSDGPDALLIQDMLIEQNGGGVNCMYTPRCSVRDSTFRNNDGAAIRMHAPDLGGSGLVQRNRIHQNGTGLVLANYAATIVGNRIEDNDDLGVEIDYISQVQMSRNVVGGNGGHGVVVSFLSDATISGNRIEGNAGDGVAVLGDLFFGDTSALVRHNRIDRNGGDGVLVEAEGAHAVVERNRTDRNGDDGIDVRNAATQPAPPPDAVDTVVRANRAYFNADLGIHALPGTTDGGGNRARHNGNPAQCVGVSCR